MTDQHRTDYAQKALPVARNDGLTDLIERGLELDFDGEADA